MRHFRVFAAFILSFILASMNVHAYFNSTYLDTTVFFTNSTTVHVVESVQLFVSNSSISQYDQDRQAFNLSVGDWQKAVGSSLLVEHIIDPKGSITNFTFLPGPIVPASNGNGYASLTFSYDAANVTTVKIIAPRKFEYAFNASAFNFQHTASGQSLLPSTRLTFMIPSGAQVVSVYPLPDYPQPNSVGQYNGTTFAWFSGEPLQKFSFVYVTTETPQQEVVQYFSSIYDNYRTLVYITVLLVLAAIVLYIYTRVFR